MSNIHSHKFYNFRSWNRFASALLRVVFWSAFTKSKKVLPNMPNFNWRNGIGEGADIGGGRWRIWLHSNQIYVHFLLYSTISHELYHYIHSGGMNCMPREWFILQIIIKSIFFIAYFLDSISHWFLQRNHPTCNYWFRPLPPLMVSLGQQVMGQRMDFIKSKIDCTV